MTRQGLLHYYPERIAWIGALVLAAGSLIAIPILWVMGREDFLSLVSKERKEKEIGSSFYSFSLGIREDPPHFAIPALQKEMTFSFDPPRPNGEGNGRVLVRLTQSGESRRVVLPCRLDLKFQETRLVFAKEPSLFWIELSLALNGQIEAKGFIAALDGTKMDAGSFSLSGQECPIQEAHEFPQGSPFRLLAEAKWWGRDLFLGAATSGERIEIGSEELLEIQKSDWLVWKEGKWQRANPLEPVEKEIPIVHIQSTTVPKTLILEGWDSDDHTRLALNLAESPPFKVKGEDLFSSIRIRSEKQISCMIEKQCMVLKLSDWVLKKNGRWKILRKKEEKDAFLNGKLFGELFILEQISQKQGQKMIQGRLFNSGRTQMISIEMAAQSGRKTGEQKRRKSP